MSHRLPRPQSLAPGTFVLSVLAWLVFAPPAASARAGAGARASATAQQALVRDHRLTTHGCSAVTVSSPPAAIQTGSPIKFTGTIAPAQLGTPVVLQRLARDGRWTPIARGHDEGAGGEFSITHVFSVPSRGTPAMLRVRCPSRTAALRAVSTPFAVTITRSHATREERRHRREERRLRREERRKRREQAREERRLHRLQAREQRRHRREERRLRREERRKRREQAREERRHRREERRKRREEHARVRL